MTNSLPSFAHKIAQAMSAVFGEGPLTMAVQDACTRYAHDLSNIQAGRGINALVLAIVGAKGQGKTWVARQFVRDTRIQALLRSGDLVDDATTRLVWIGPVAPEGLDPAAEIYHPCPANQLVQVGQPYVLLDTPGLTDADHRAAQLAEQALSLAPVKLLVIARDQLRAAANMLIAHQIDGSLCIPIISSVEPEEMSAGTAAAALAEDLRTLRTQLEVMAPRSTILSELLVPDFEISGDEAAAGQVFLSGLLDRLSDLGITENKLTTAREQRSAAAAERLKAEVAQLIGDELPHLASAVQQLHRETEHLPERVLASLLGSEALLSTGVRMRLRTRLVSDTSLLWFPYRTIMSTLNLTQGAWDRVVLALTGSVPSLFGALASWARNAKQSREFTADVQDGIRRRTQQQVEERLRPLCQEFHRTVMKLRPRDEQSRQDGSFSGLRLSGIEELQLRSQQIFDAAIDRHATRGLVVQLLALLGVSVFWLFMAGPIILIYRQYLAASLEVLRGAEAAQLDHFPHPSPSLLLTSLLLSLLPVALYCMVVLTWSLSRRKVQRVAQQIIQEHQSAIDELKAKQVIRLEFEDELLQQAEFLLRLL
ncbi:MAG: hypothetical protein KDA45_04745 [Planctomycetales bacterium]|nr:hypothetical protein [Planctomycetales bacterium]